MMNIWRNLQVLIAACLLFIFLRPIPSIGWHNRTHMIQHQSQRYIVQASDVTPNSGGCRYHAACYIHPVSLDSAVKQSLVKMQLRGDGTFTSSCQLLLTNTGRHTQHVTVPAYQFFVPDKPKFQIMMSTETSSAEIKPLETAVLVIRTVCASPKTFKAPPPEGVAYSIGAYPDTQTQRLLTQIIETAKVLETRNCYDALPLKAETRRQTIAQLAIWKILGQQTKVKEDQISHSTIANDLLQKAHLPRNSLSAQEKHAFDQGVDAIFQAVDLTIKESRSAVTYSGSPSDKQPVAFFRPQLDGNEPNPPAKKPVPAESTDKPPGPGDESKPEPLPEYGPKAGQSVVEWALDEHDAILQAMIEDTKWLRSHKKPQDNKADDTRPQWIKEREEQEKQKEAERVYEYQKREDEAFRKLQKLLEEARELEKTAHRVAARGSETSTAQKRLNDIKKELLNAVSDAWRAVDNRRWAEGIPQKK